MNYLLIYFGIVLFILVAKFVQALCTINKLKTFIANNRNDIFLEHKLSGAVYNYLELFGFHFSTFSYGEDYEKNMRYDLRNYNHNMWKVFLFALFWPLSIPFSLVFLLIRLLYNLFNKILGNVLGNAFDENTSFEYQEEYY